MVKIGQQHRFEPSRPGIAVCQRQGAVYSLAAGYQAMDSLARVFNIPDFIWQQQDGGEVFVGSWADSFFDVRSPLRLPVELFEDYQATRVR